MTRSIPAWKADLSGGYLAWSEVWRKEYLLINFNQQVDEKQLHQTWTWEDISAKTQIQI